MLLSIVAHGATANRLITIFVATAATAASGAIRPLMPELRGITAEYCWIRTRERERVP